MSLISSLASLLIVFGLGSAALALLRYNGGFMLSQLGIPSALMILAGLVYAGARLSGAGQGLGSPAAAGLPERTGAGRSPGASPILEPGFSNPGPPALACGSGPPTLQRLDRMFCAGLLAMQGLYACLCRGVSAGGFICTGILTAFYLAAWLASGERPGRFAWGLIALVWIAVLYRYFAPIPPMWLQPAGLPGAP